MRLKNYTVSLRTRGLCHVLDLTREIEDRVRESRVQQGNVTVFAPGSTAGVTTLEFEPGVVQDLEDLFDKLAPPTRDYHHEQAWHDGNGFSHMRAALLKPSLVVPIVDGAMVLGTWQQLVFVDFDNRHRDRRVVVQVMGEFLQP